MMTLPTPNRDDAQRVKSPDGTKSTRGSDQADPARIEV